MPRPADSLLWRGLLHSRSVLCRHERGGTGASQGEEQEQAANGEPEAPTTLSGSELLSTSPTPRKRHQTYFHGLAVRVCVCSAGWQQVLCRRLQLLKGQTSVCDCRWCSSHLGRRSLDFDATQKINEQLGNTINLPSLPASGIALNIQPSPLRCLLGTFGRVRVL